MAGYLKKMLPRVKLKWSFSSKRMCITQYDNDILIIIRIDTLHYYITGHVFKRVVRKSEQ